MLKSEQQSYKTIGTTQYQSDLEEGNGQKVSERTDPCGYNQAITRGFELTQRLGSNLYLFGENICSGLSYRSPATPGGKDGGTKSGG